MTSPIFKEKNLTACGNRIIIPYSQQQHILSAHPDVVSVLAEALCQVTLPTDGSELKLTVDLGRPVGRSGIVETNPIGFDEEATFAIRNGRKGPSRVVTGVESSEVSTVGIIAVQARGKPPQREVLPGKYMLLTAFLGSTEGGVTYEPWDEAITEDSEARANAVAFWSRWAFDYNYLRQLDIVGETFTSSWADVLGQK